MLNKWQRGDTIVEVMIVLAILGLAISISYATANRSLISTRQAQENAEATEILRGQIEALRAVSCTDASDTECVRPTPIDTLNTPFCMIPNGTGGYKTHTYIASENPNPCHLQAIPYKVTIVNKNITAGLYELKANWDSLRGEQDSVTLSYRAPR